MRNTEFLSFYNFMKSEGLNRLFYQYNNDLRAKQYEVPINTTADYIKPGDHVLDWSCGNGHFSLYLGYRQAQTVGSSFYDTTPEYLREQSFFSLKLVSKEEPVNLPFADSSFDAVVSVGVLEHVHETGGSQIASLKEIRRILRPDGYFLCFHLPYLYSCVENIGRVIPDGLRKKLPVGHPHSRRFNRKMVATMLDQTGFSLLASGVYNFLPRNFSYALPSSLSNNRIFAASYNAADAFLSAVFPFFCSQLYFIAAKSCCDSSECR